jgi:hypothetical protein
MIKQHLITSMRHGIITIIIFSSDALNIDQY